MVSSVSGGNSLSYYQGQAALSILTSSSSTSTADTTSALLSYYESKEGLSSASSAASTAAAAPTAPWNSSTDTPSVETAVQNAVNGAQIVDPSAAKLDAPAGVSSQDYRNLFAVYQGLNTLYDLAQTSANAGASSADQTLSYLPASQLQATFASGMSQVENFLSNSPFQEFNLTAGQVKTTATSTVGIPNGSYQTYTTGVMGVGDENQPLTSLQGDVSFNVTVTNTAAATKVKLPDGTTKTIAPQPLTIPIDLTNMGDKPRTIDNVVNYINTQLKSAGVSTRFAAANLGATASTTTLPNGTTETNAGSTQWGLTINGVSSESVSFSAPSTAAAVYVSMGVGGAVTYAPPSATAPANGATTNADGQTLTATGEQVMKLQTGNDATGPDGVATITNAGNTSGLPSGAVFAKSLPDGVGSIEASATGADGSVYLLADATGSVNGAPIQGAQGVALLKYDSSGKLLYSKVVPGLQTASGASIAVNTDGSVAVAGTNTTNATTNSSGVPTAAQTQAFVQVYDPTGAPAWSQAVPAVGGATVASGVAFGSDGSVYLSGGTNGSVGFQLTHGTSDEFIQGFDKTGAAAFTQQFGANGGVNIAQGMAYDPATNSLYAVGLENSKAVVRSFSLTTTTTGTGASRTTKTNATQTGSRSLGVADSIAGIGVSNGQVIVGGTTTQATITSGSVTQAYKGVSDGFITSISGNLAPSSGDTVAYLGMSGATQTATGMTVAGGQAYLTGTIANDPSSLASPNATEGFVAGVDASTGQVTYSTRLAGQNGQSAPTSVTVAAAGSSVLDRLGLPSGTINAAVSNLITSATSIKAGQSFWVRTSPGGQQQQVTITAADTLQTLAAKLNIALGGQGTAAVEALGANSELSIVPSSASAFIELDSQAASNTNPGASATSLNTDVLSALGLQAGVIRTVRQVNNVTDPTQLREYGLDLPTNLDISNPTSAQHAANVLQAAMSAVQSAYQDLASPPTIASETAAAQQSSGDSTVPTYLTNEISNLQAGLSRLTAGQGSSSGSDPTLALFGV